MIKTILTLCFMMVGSLVLTAQDFVQVAIGAGYGQQTYYRLSDDNMLQIANEDWDLAFSAIGQTDVGISINESTTSVTGMPAPELKLFLTDASDFSEVIDTFSIGTRLYNNESGWDNGALNNLANPADPFDLGWGRYNVTNHTLTGTRVFAVELRNGTYKKFIIESFAQGAYSLKYANLDGTDEQSVGIRKADFPDAPIALFSFSTGETLPSVGAFDLLFCRYYTKLDDGTGNLLDYPVTGVLSAPGVEVAQATGVDPTTVDYTAYVDSFTTQLDAIGYDWKSFNFAAGWVIPDDRAYFVKTSDNLIYKLVFVDFEGSSTGISTFEKTELGVLSSVQNRQSNFAEASVYPNPVVDQATIAFTLKQNQNNLEMRLIDLSGRIVWQTNGVPGNEGLNILNLPRLNLPQGMYLLSIANGPDVITLKMMQK